MTIKSKLMPYCLWQRVHLRVHLLQLLQFFSFCPTIWWQIIVYNFCAEDTCKYALYRALHAFVNFLLLPKHTRGRFRVLEGKCRTYPGVWWLRVRNDTNLPSRMMDYRRDPNPSLQRYDRDAPTWKCWLKQVIERLVRTGAADVAHLYNLRDVIIWYWTSKPTWPNNALKLGKSYANCRANTWVQILKIVRFIAVQAAHLVQTRRTFPVWQTQISLRQEEGHAVPQEGQA